MGKRIGLGHEIECGLYKLVPNHLPTGLSCLLSSIDSTLQWVSMISIMCVFLSLVVRQFLARKYGSLVWCQQGSNLQGAKVMRLCVEKKDEGGGRCVS